MTGVRILVDVVVALLAGMGAVLGTSVTVCGLLHRGGGDQGA
ncbi:hypothetical protein ACIG0D_07255 [Streptomyces sp. NPDC052773]